MWPWTKCRQVDNTSIHQWNKIGSPAKPNVYGQVIFGKSPKTTQRGIKNFFNSWAPVAHACNPSYSGGRDQEEHSLKPAWANSSQNPISKIPNTKRASGVAQGIGPEFKPRYCKRKKKIV
jgi:hypothetical protein